MTDRELLELAAKAVGGDFVSQTEYDEETGGYKTRTWIREPERLVEWNPLKDDGDALRLAVKLELTIYPPQPNTAQYDKAACQDHTAAIDILEPNSENPEAATRRAIVRAAALAFDNNKLLNEWGMIVSNTYEETYSAMLAAAPQPEPDHNWCAGCSPDNCSGCGAEPVESEPAMWVMKHIRSGDLAQAKPNQKALHPYMWSDAFPRYTTPQPDRVTTKESYVELDIHSNPSRTEQQRKLDGSLEVGQLLGNGQNQETSHSKTVGDILLTDAFRGDAANLIESIVALVSLDRAGVLVPHGIGGHARSLLESAAIRLSQPDRVAELEAALKVARDGIDKFLVANDPTEFGCACDLSVGYLCGPCHADKQQQPLKSALAKINEVLKP